MEYDIETLVLHYLPTAETVIIIVARSTFGMDPLKLAREIIFSIDSLMSCKEARLIMTDNITMAIGSSFVLPKNKRKIIILKNGN